MPDRNTAPLIAALVTALLTLGAAPVTARVDPDPSPTHHAGEHFQGACPTHTSSTGTTISHCSAAEDPYVPDIAAATPEDLTRAQQLFDVVMAFCASHAMVDDLRWDGYYPVHSGASHWRLGKTWTRAEFDPNHPRMAVIDRQGRVIGVMFADQDGFPYLGSIPRPHIHEAGGNEMLHVWCTPDSLQQAFATRKPTTPTMPA